MASNTTDVDVGVDVQPEVKLENSKEDAMRAELKHIDKMYTQQGEAYFAETVDEDIPEQLDWWGNYALCLVRHMHPSNSKIIQSTSLQVNSPHLKELLKETIQNYPGISFQTNNITIDKPYRVLFHNRRELEDAGKQFDRESEAAAHLQVLLNFINAEFKDSIEENDNLREQGMVSYQHLWTVFRPGATIYAPLFGQPRAYCLKSCDYVNDPPAFALNLQHIDFDGENFGFRQSKRFIEAYNGAERIDELSAYPIEWHPEASSLQQSLIARGRRWEQHAGMHFCYYKGIGLEHTPCGMARYSVNGRVVVDTKTTHRLVANTAFTVAPLKYGDETRIFRRRVQEGVEAKGEKAETDPLTDAQCLMANAVVRGFSFTVKRWLDFFIDNLSEPGWNPDCFDQLVLPHAQKETVRALVASYAEKRLGFDDIVKGKGEGLIMVLHGPPGVGKTLTAETVAEYCKRPLYMVSSGDLGTESSKLDERLTRILDMASTWKAVLLIDEADVFLERRSLQDLERNSLVSIFLRVLEYYGGILFLTSNRVSTFDDAFKSRIHVPLKYNDLTVASRKQIWRNFLGKMGSNAICMDDEGYESLARANINGRQIKNVIRTAQSLAQFHGQRLDRAKLEQVIEIQMEFERELEGRGCEYEQEKGGSGHEAKAGMSNGVQQKMLNGVNGHAGNGHAVRGHSNSMNSSDSTRR